MFDAPTHFKNETIQRLTKGLKVPHHYWLPYKAWRNKPVERLGKEHLKVCRSITVELHMKAEEWSYLLPIVQTILNNSPSPQNRNIPLLTVSRSMKPTAPISMFMRSSVSAAVTVTDMQRERMINIPFLKQNITQIHSVVQVLLEISRNRAREVVLCEKLSNFYESSFVLVARDNFTSK